MSRHHSRTQAAASLARSRRRDAVPVYRGTEDEAHADRMTARAKALAPTLGYCGCCGVSVDEANGKLHDKWCAVDAERREARP